MSRRVLPVVVLILTITGSIEAQAPPALPPSDRPVVEAIETGAEEPAHAWVVTVLATCVALAAWRRRADRPL